MKKILTLAVVLAACFTLCAQENSAAEEFIQFSPEKLQAFVKRGTCILTENNSVLTVKGNVADKNNKFRFTSIPVPLTKVAGKELTFGAMVKTNIVKGFFVVAIREINAENKSIRYVRYVFTKTQDWTEFSKTFKVDAKSDRLEIYLLGENLTDESFGSVKALYCKFADK